MNVFILFKDYWKFQFETNGFEVLLTWKILISKLSFVAKHWLKVLQWFAFWFSKVFKVNFKAWSGNCVVCIFVFYLCFSKIVSDEGSSDSSYWKWSLTFLYRISRDVYIRIWYFELENICNKLLRLNCVASVELCKL